MQDFPDLGAAIEAYLAGRAVDQAVIAVATPVETDVIKFTNSPWTFSIDGLRARLGLRRLAVINDFVAQALAMPHLAADELEQIGTGHRDPGPRGGRARPGHGARRVGPGARQGRLDGLADRGRPRLVRARQRARGCRCWRRLRQRLGHVSNERLLSGQGLLNLAQSLATIDGRTCAADSPAAVTEAARAGSCPSCREAVAAVQRACSARPPATSR